MDGLTSTLVLGALAIGLSHTLLGPDHYLPFLMLARARGWSLLRTLTVTAACGVGHVLSSVLIGAVGLAFGVAIGALERAEGVRGDLGAWAFVAFGLAYAAWGARQAVRRARGLAPHQHVHQVHIHGHGDHPHGHAHDHMSDPSTFWTLFLAFVLGPCEPLIPLFVLPASRGRYGLAITTAVVFGVVTVATMLSVTLLGFLGLRRLPLGPFNRWSHAMAGGVIALSGAGVLALGL
ncbi:MAG: hypothetical protein HY903_24950 [Deltaproteobacteria bacterium]|nr:hypothetical protein [Deltaproteobacteria bacterium]